MTIYRLFLTYEDNKVCGQNSAKYLFGQGVDTTRIAASERSCRIL